MEKMNLWDEISKLYDLIEEDLKRTKDIIFKDFKKEFLNHIYLDYENLYNDITGEKTIYIIQKTSDFITFSPNLFTYKEIKQIRKINKIISSFTKED